MNDYKELIEELKAHCGCIIYDDDCSKCEGLESEKALCSLSMQLIKRCADAIEQLVKERDAAVRDLGKLRYCSNCKLCTETDNDDYYWCSAFCDWNEYNDTCENWEWRGVQE